MFTGVALQKMRHVCWLGLAWQYWLVSVCQTLSKLNLRPGSIVSEAILKKGTDARQTDIHSASKCLSCVNTGWKPPRLLKWASQGVCKHICQSSQTNTRAARRKFWEVKINVIWVRIRILRIFSITSGWSGYNSADWTDKESKLLMILKLYKVWIYNKIVKIFNK